MFVKLLLLCYIYVPVNFFQRRIQMIMVFFTLNQFAACFLYKNEIGSYRYDRIIDK